MALKKLFNGHYRRIPSSKKETTSKNSDPQLNIQQNEEQKDHKIINNIIYGAGIGIGAFGLGLAIFSCTIIASTVLFSTYLCVHLCNNTEDDNIEFIKD